jgi:hypothetical protein
VEERSVVEYKVPELAGGDPRYRIIRRGDLLAIYGQTELLPEPAVFALNPSRMSEKPTLIGKAWFFIPSAVEGRVWLSILDPTSPATVRALKAIREVDMDGSITRPDVAPPDGRWPIGASARGLLFQGDASLDLWSPETETMVDALPGPFPVAISEHRLVTCGVPCEELQLIDLERDSQRRVELPEGIAQIDAYGGAFSPDGQFVAVIGFDEGGPLSENTGVSVALVDFQMANVRVVSDSLSRPWDYPQVAWTSSGEWLFFKNGPTLFAVEPETGTAYRVDVELDGPHYGLAVG